MNRIKRQFYGRHVFDAVYKHLDGEDQE